MENEIYISHLLDDGEMQDVICQTGCGIESIDFSMASVLEELEPSMIRYRKRLEQMGTDKLSIHGPFLDLNPMAFDPLVLEATRYRYEQAYTAAKELGAEKIIYHTCYIPRVYMLIGWAERVIDFWNRFLEGKEGIQVLMENVQDPEIEPVLQVAQEIAHPDFGLCFDLGHAHCYARESVVKWARQLGPYVKHLHLHDNDGMRDGHQALGTGNLPLKETISIIKEYNPQISGTIECSTKADVLRSWNYWNDFM